MQIVILAAGRGDRFVQAGYKVLKPFIKVNNRPMISYAIELAYNVSSEVVVVCPEGVLADVWGQVLTERRTAMIVGVRYTQSGAAMSLLTAGAKLNEDEPVLVMDCDSIINEMAMRKFIAYTETAFEDGYESSLMAFVTSDKSNRYSFVELGPDNSVLDVAEKVRISNLATCGVHAFKSWRSLRYAICHMVYDEQTTNNEYYVAPVHSYLPEHDHKTKAYIVQEGDYFAIGTPEQLEEYERRTSPVK